MSLEVLGEAAVRQSFLSLLWATLVVLLALHVGCCAGRSCRAGKFLRRFLKCAPVGSESMQQAADVSHQTLVIK